MYLQAPTPPVFEQVRLPMYQQHSLLPTYSAAAPDVPPMSLPPFLVSPPSLPSDASSSPSSQKESFADLHICPYCNRNFKYKNNLYTHIKNKHKQDNQPSQCEVCGKHFASKASMSFHQNKFHMPQNLACKLCPLRFSLPVYLNAHMKVNNSASP
jgi:hypothetical protein